MIFFLFFCISFICSLALVPGVKLLARRLGVIDKPQGGKKHHQKDTPLLGGVAVIVSFILGLSAFLLYGQPDFSSVPPLFFSGLIFASTVLLIGGVLDDKYNLSPGVQIFFPGLAGLVLVLCGIGTGITFVSSPVGGKIWLDWEIGIVPAAGIFSWLWLMGMTYTTKLLDGMDGLASGVGAVGALVMLLLTLQPHINQPTVGVLSIILFGALLGFLCYGFYPATIFLGESGSTFIGFILGALAILTGAKIATALLVMAVPIIDLAWTILRRLLHGQSPFHGDRGHLHHLLLDAGLSQRQIAIYMYCATASFGVVALFLETAGKAVVFGFIVLFSIWFLGWLLHRKPRTVI